ncbi:M48 family metalloprotease [Flavobacterium alkalisoli]|uniref:M48 family metalloprotease n=1 Tax=Flavobacterium alkalisoli TaxID=2602769 RepID=UPI003A922D44
MNHTITISKNFKQKTVMAILAIILFVITYLVLIAAALGLTILCGYGAIMLIALRPLLITIMLGLGLGSMGLLILFFLIKFIFAVSKKEEPDYIRIYEEDEPELFALIEDIVAQVGTSFPKKIYVSHQVNASVFYNSSFWSMFLPVKKNLVIGMGLMNSVTVDEFKAIMAHEFGHFSQKSMKVGSYVYNVNQIIHNMLYKNDSFDEVAKSWSDVSTYFALFTLLGIQVITGIKWILKQVYNVLNLSHSALSREMEFHADEVAASVAGSSPVASSLVRLDLASISLERVLNFYSGKIEQNIRPVNIYPQQQFLMFFIATENKLPIENGLPMVTLENKSRLNLSKLKFDDKWATHPSDEDRVNRVKNLNLTSNTINNNPSLSLIKDATQLQLKVTSKLFSKVPYTSRETKNHGIEDFEIEFNTNVSKNSFDKKFNKYFDDFLTPDIDLNDIIETTTTEKELFSEENVELHYNIKGLESDLAIVKQISHKETPIKTFGFDGKNYKKQEAAVLAVSIENDIEQLKEKKQRNDRKIFSFYYHIALQSGKAEEYKNRYKTFAAFTKKGDEELRAIDEIKGMTLFLNETTTFKKIESNFRKLFPKEQILREKIRQLLNNSEYESILVPELKDNLNKYASYNWTYFENESYKNENLQTFFNGIDAYVFVLQVKCRMLKKDFLDFQATLTSI